MSFLPPHLPNYDTTIYSLFVSGFSYAIMTKCWAMKQEHRVSFEQIVADITQIVQSAKSGRADQNRNLYINIATAVVARPDYRQTTV